MEEKYEGVKFRTVFFNKEIPFEDRIETLKQWAKVFDENKLAPPYEGGSAGNLSFRVHPDRNEFIITGSKIGLKCSLANDCFVKVLECDSEKNIVYVTGTREPSSESMLHFNIYKERKDVQAIFHGHCQLILDAASKLKIPVTKEFFPYGTMELVQSVLEILNVNKALIMKDHGFLSLGGSLNEAGEISLDLLKQAAL